MRNKIRIILIIILALLSLSSFLRYDQGPQQTDGGIKYSSVKDRWTGQTWIKIIGSDQGTAYSGELRPDLSAAAIQQRENFLRQNGWAKKNPPSEAPAAARQALEKEIQSTRHRLTAVWSILTVLNSLALLLVFKPDKLSSPQIE